MGRIIAISSGDLESTKSINEYAVKMLQSASKHVLFIGTASGDAEGYVENITNAFSQMGCTVRALQLTKQVYCAEEMAEMVSWADIIYVGGGDTIFMMNRWKQYGLDAMLKDVYQRDTAILMGISAGAICWFDCGCTDSELAVIRDGARYGWADGMLGMHHYAFCPHYEDRVEDFALLMQEKSIEGLALESNVAFVEENGKVFFMRCSEDAKAYRIRCENAGFEKEEIKKYNKV